MSRVLLGGFVATSPRELSRPDPTRDPFVRELLEQESARAYARGHADGARAAAAEAHAAGVAAAGAVRGALEELLDARRRVYADDAVAVAELACEVAEAVFGATPADGGAALVQRLTDVLATVDDDALVVTVAAADLAVVRDALAAEAGVEVRCDPALQPGDARARGAWAQADLTRAAALRAVRSLLGVPDARS